MSARHSTVSLVPLVAEVWPVRPGQHVPTWYQELTRGRRGPVVVINSMLSESLLPATPKRAPTASLAQWLTLVASLASLTLAVIALWRTEALERARPSVKATLTPRYRASLLQTAESDARWTPFDPDPTRLRWIRFSSGGNSSRPHDGRRCGGP